MLLLSSLIRFKRVYERVDNMIYERVDNMIKESV